MNPTILRLLKEAASGYASTQDLEQLTRLLVLKGYYTPPPIEINNKKIKEILKKTEKITPQERDLILRDPGQAFMLALKEKKPSEDTRISASKDPQYAFRYASEIDKVASVETRNGACQDFLNAMRYAKWEGARSPLKEMLCKSAEGSFRYALEVQKTSCEETRNGASREPLYALQYAREVDRSPHPVTRTGACGDSKCAYFYALQIDKVPTDETRLAACRGARRGHFAFFYARFLDNAYHPVTWEATDLRDRYRAEIGQPTE